MQSHVDPCPLCEGPCVPGFHLPPIHARYPFLPPEVIAMTQPAEPKPEQKKEATPPPPPSGKRAKKLQEDRMRRPNDNR